MKYELEEAHERGELEVVDLCHSSVALTIH